MSIISFQCPHFHWILNSRFPWAQQSLIRVLCWNGGSAVGVQREPQFFRYTPHLQDWDIPLDLSVLARKGGSSTGMGKLRTELCTLEGLISDYFPLCARGSCTERCSPKYKQYKLPPSPPGTELEMTTQEVCLHRCKVSHAFIFSCGFYKIRGIKRKRQQLEAPEIVCIKNPPILCYMSKACARFQLPKSIWAVCEMSNTLIWKNF